MKQKKYIHKKKNTYTEDDELEGGAWDVEEMMMREAIRLSLIDTVSRCVGVCVCVCVCVCARARASSRVTRAVLFRRHFYFFYFFVCARASSRLRRAVLFRRHFQKSEDVVRVEEVCVHGVRILRSLSTQCTHSQKSVYTVSQKVRLLRGLSIKTYYDTDF